MDRFTNRQPAAVLLAAPFGSLDQRSPRGTLDLVGTGIPRRVFHANQLRRMGVRRALPPTGRAVLLAGSRARTSVVRSLAQCVGAGRVGPDCVLVAVPRHQCRATFQCLENPSVRRAMPDDDLHGRRPDARQPPIMASVGHSCDVVCHRRVRSVPAGRTRRLCPADCGYCTGGLLIAETERRENSAATRSVASPIQILIPTTPALDSHRSRRAVNCSGRCAVQNSLLDGLVQRLGGSANAATIFGAPLERGDVTVIPVARASYAFGGGSGTKSGEEGSGGGGGVRVAPVGYIEIRPASFSTSRSWTGPS